MISLAKGPSARRHRGQNRLKAHPRSVRKFHRRMIALLRSRGFAGKELEEETLRMRRTGTPYVPPDAPPSARRALAVHAASAAPGSSAHRARRSVEPLQEEAPVSSFRTKKFQHRLASKAARDAKRDARQQARGGHQIN